MGSLNVQLNAKEIIKIKKVAEYIGQGTFSPPANVTVGEMVQELPMKYTAVQGTAWQGAQKDTNEMLTPLQIWDMPADFSNLTAKAVLTDPSESEETVYYPKAFPMRMLKKSDTDQYEEKQIFDFAWATKLNVTIRRIDDGDNSVFNKYTYELVGVRESDMILLERLMRHVKMNPSDLPVKVKLLYKDEANRNELTCSENQLLFIQKANCSIETNPSDLGLSRTEETLDERPDMDLFIRRLWEGSVTRSGGFFLFHYDIDNKSGIPERLFEVRDEAQVRLLFLWPDYEEAKEELPELRPYINTVVTDRIPEDEEHASIYVKLLTYTIDRPSDGHPALETLASIYFTDASVIAVTNRLLQLTPGVPLQIRNGTYMVRESQPDNSSTIAEHFKIKEEDLLTTNPGLRQGEKLHVSMAVRLPELVVVTTPEQNMEQISKQFGIPVAALGADNRHISGLFAPGGTIRLVTGNRNRIGVTPPGAVEVRAVRPAPVEWSDGDAFMAEHYLASMFQMLQPRLCRNFDFRASNPGLPAGPKVSETEGFVDFHTADPSAEWWYSRSIPYSMHAAATNYNAPSSPVSNPYEGAGKMLQLDLQWLDLFGNRIQSNLDDYSANSGTANRMPTIVGYSDTLLGLSRWPFVSVDYVLEPDAGNRSQVLLCILLKFDASSLRINKGTHEKTVRKRALEALATYRSILNQMMPLASGGELGFQWRTSLLPAGPRYLSEPNKRLMLKMLRRIWEWLSNLACHPDKFNDPDIAYTLNEPIVRREINKSNLFELTVDVLLTRPLDAVSPLFRSSRHVFESSTRILPRRIAEPRDKGKPSLRQFAIMAERALCQENRYFFKLAVGSDRNRVVHARTEQPVWLVRFASKGSNEGLHYDIPKLDKSKLAIYAPKPMINRSEPFEYRQTWCYRYRSDGSDESGFYENPEAGMVQKNRESMEKWAQNYLASVDRMLSPRNCSAMGVIRKLTQQDHTIALQELKKKLAKVVSGLLDYVYRDTPPDIERHGPVRELYRQRLLKELSNAYYIGAAIQFQVEESGGEAGDERPGELCRLYGPIVPNEKEVPAGFSLTNARIPVHRTVDGAKERAFLQFALSGTRVGAGAALQGENTVQPFVDLDVGFLPTHIEHQIEALPSSEVELPEDVYQASSWLHFIVPPAEGERSEWQLYRTLGSFKVPLILRAFPEEPHLVTQSFEDPLKSGKEQGPLTDYLMYDYLFTYRRTKHYTQDRVYFHVKFNELITEKPSFADTEDLCTTLALFNDVYKDLEKDLDDQIGKLTKIPDTFNEETLPLIDKIFHDYLEMANRVADSWITESEAEKFLDDSGYRFFLSETGINDEDRQAEAYLVVRFEEQTPLPKGMKQPMVTINGYRTLLNKVTCSRDPKTDKVLNVYEFAFQDENGTKLLSASDGQTIPERTVRFPNINIVVNQNVCLYSHVTRNEELIEGFPLAEPFVYRTGEKKMAKPIKPYLVRNNRIDMAKVSGSGRPLEDHLSVFFKALFDGCAPDSCQKVQLEFFYSYRISQKSFRPSLPIALFPPLEMELPKLYMVSDNWTVGRYNRDASFVCNLTSRLWRAFSENPPRGDDGSIEFKLTVMTNRTAEDIRLVDLNVVTLGIEHVNPTPPLYDVACKHVN
ncbi:LysM domain containing peptidoglycan-binding protein [Bacillus atrophaeus UCMB-5137]|uniref:hypothetical protein n=1 Tax=Bacillus atrophaeus TaxID=1452 RepID=UPI00032D7FAB|nr:hypothetical protein [Bacillus atrophaeus]AKL83315.1 LysM domain containing peptidoglycan-binding protein [Bacillus atrophaeus UCMB-5137]